MSRLRIVAVLACLLGGATSTVWAQEPPRLTVAGGFVWTGSHDLGSRTADLRGNAPGTAPPAFQLFRVDGRVDGAAGVEGRVGVRLGRGLAVEGAIAYARPRIAVAVASDVEAPAVQLDGETLSEYLFDVSLVWDLPISGPGARFRPFAVGGGGYLRQLHEGRALVESGQLYHVGAGVRYYLRGTTGAERPLGVRADVQAAIRRHGVDLDDKARMMPRVSLLIFAGF